MLVFGVVGLLNEFYNSSSSVCIASLEPKSLHVLAVLGVSEYFFEHFFHIPLVECRLDIRTQPCQIGCGLLLAVEFNGGLLGNQQIRVHELVAEVREGNGWESRTYEF